MIELHSSVKKGGPSAITDWGALRQGEATSSPVALCGHQPKSGASGGATSAIPETSNRTSTTLRKAASSKCP